MGLSADDYTGLLLQLLPPGPAWPQEDSQASRMLAAWAEEFARLDARSGALVEEADPRTTYELLADWERVAGLPDICSETGADLTIFQRRAMLVAKLISQGGQTPQYFIDVAAAVGYSVTITEFRPLTFGGEFGTPWHGADWAYAWQINAPETTRTFAEFGVSAFGERWSLWGNALLECVITPLKPGHTILLFSYS